MFKEPKMSHLSWAALGAGLSLSLCTALAAQPPQLEDSEPGEVFLTPQIDLGLVETPVDVPAQFAGRVPEGAVLKLPPGFRAKIFAAEGLRGPRMMAFSPEGVLHVANMKAGDASQWGPASNGQGGQIVALPDGDGDGVADQAIVVAEGFRWANSLAFFEGALYVVDTHELLRLSDGDGDGIYEERQLVAEIPTGGQHVTRTLAIDRDNRKFYIGVGSSGDLLREAVDERATILQMNPDGSERRIFTRGWRNPVGLAFHPLTNQLWATNNGHDREGRDLPPETVDIVRDGGFYGWPLAFGYQRWTDFGIAVYEEALFPLTAQDSANVASMQRPALQLPAHLAPMMIHFYTGDAFPELYHQAAFIALRGGSNANVVGHKVVAAFVGADGSGAQVGDFLTGFQPNANNTNGVWGKPVGLIQDSGGALYLSSDWVNHFIIKIAPNLLQGRASIEAPPVAYVGGEIELLIRVNVDQLDPQGEAPTATADLSAFGAQLIELKEASDGAFEVLVRLPVGQEVGSRDIEVLLQQRTAADLNTLRFSQEVQVVRGEDLPVFTDELADDWQPNGSGGVEVLAATDDGPVFAGDRALPIQILDASLLGWRVTLTAPEPVVADEYGVLRFALHPGDAVEPGSRPRLAVSLRPGRTIDLTAEGLINLNLKEWQQVELPLELFELDGRAIDGLRFDGTIEGTFYVDEVRLETRFLRSATAVLEERQDVAPQDFSLGQNYPNPFNSGTSIRYALERAGQVELAVYNLAGQQVVRLVEGRREVGAYAVNWDGRAADGAELASGVYIYRLRTEAGILTRKLLLLQ
jgi:glucose/arabinose dehydrogenase